MSAPESVGPRLLAYSAVPHAGGASRLIVARLSGLAARGWQVRLAAKDRADLAEGYRAIRAAGGAVTLLDAGGSRWPGALRARWAGLVAAARDTLVVIHRHTPVAGWLEAVVAGVLRRRLVIVDHTPHPAGPAPWRVRAAAVFAARCYQNSDEAARRARAAGAAAPDKVRVLPAFVPVGPAPVAGRRRRFREALGVGADAFVVLCVSSHYEEAKGVGALIAAFAAVRRARPEAVLVCVGRGLDAAGYGASVAAAGLEGAVHLAGWVDDPRGWMEASDCLVHPSNYEAGVCLAVLEALDAGLPLVVSDIPMHRPLVEAGAAREYRRGDPASLVAALAAAPARDPRAAAEFRARYRPDVVLDRLDREYRELLG